MEHRGTIPEGSGPNRRYTQKKRFISETNARHMSAEELLSSAEPERDFVELEGGFTMYPSEILGFSDGNDNPV
ncbi:MAG: hypothetical protein VB064_13750 [Oscillospiraceae bacterium]|nr:hypothetical protein [Oscillospiraceae bacterium]